MSHASNTDVIQSLHTAMHSMAVAARENDWPKVDTLDHERRRLTATLQRGQQISGPDREKINEILQFDKEVIELCQQERAAAGEQLRSLNSGRKGCAEYQSNQ